MNPILPIQHFVPDVEARQWYDGRIYLYSSYDISGRTSHCSWEHRVFSSADLIHWEDHGESFRVDFDAHPVSAFYVRAGSLAYGGLIEIRLDAPNGELLGICCVPQTGGWQKSTTVFLHLAGAKNTRSGESAG